MTNDPLGDRMKEYERTEAGRRFMPMVPIMARVDGRCFSAFTRGMERPFDERMVSCMQSTARRLATETGACLVYTQSDEISLTWYSATRDSQLWFDGRIQKMTSQLGALATLYFYLAVQREFGVLCSVSRAEPTFDARVWQVPNLAEGANTFLWREFDATKNSVQMAARHYFGHRDCVDKKRPELLDMLKARNVNWNEFPTHFKRGTYFQRVTTTGPFAVEELEALPEKHHARTNPDLTVSRSRVTELVMPPFSQVTNRVDVVYHGAPPEAAKEITGIVDPRDSAPGAGNAQRNTERISRRQRVLRKSTELFRALPLSY